MKRYIFILLVLHLFLIATCSQAKQIAIATSNNAENENTLSFGSQIKHNSNPPARLKACPDTPNCINTEYPDKQSQYISPLSFSEDLSEQVITVAKNIITDMGGTIIKEMEIERKDYLHATFTSTVFRFVDDFEIRIDNLTHKLHIRSASRTGYSDFGVNKRRVKKFTALFNQALEKTN